MKSISKKHINLGIIFVVLSVIALFVGIKNGTFLYFQPFYYAHTLYWIKKG